MKIHKNYFIIENIFTKPQNYFIMYTVKKVGGYMTNSYLSLQFVNLGEGSFSRILIKIKDTKAIRVKP